MSRGNIPIFICCSVASPIRNSIVSRQQAANLLSLPLSAWVSLICSVLYIPLSYLYIPSYPSIIAHILLFIRSFPISLHLFPLLTSPLCLLILWCCHFFTPFCLFSIRREMLWFWKFSNFFDLNRFDQVSLSLPPFHHCIALHFLFFLSFSFSSNLQSACACARCHITAAVPLPSLSILFCFFVLSSSALPHYLSLSTILIKYIYKRPQSPPPLKSSSLPVQYLIAHYITKTS